MRFDEGAVAIVTGAGAGIGRGAALAYAANGVRVIVNDANQEAAEAVCAEIRAQGGDAVANSTPVGALDSGDEIVATAMDTYGSADILFNNAGIFRDGRLWELSDADFRAVMDVNFTGVFSLIRAASKASMIPNRRGKIVNITSRVAFRGRIDQTAYAAAKLGVVGMTISASLELMEFGVNVNAVSPAAWTAMADAQLPEVRDAMRKARAACVLGRVGEVEDVLPTIMFLSSRDADYLTGQVLQATGQPVGLL